MIEYHKIKTVWKRDPETKYKTLIEGAWATPEFEYLTDCKWVFTEKVDGTNIRVMWDHEFGQIQFRGKTDKAQIPPFLLDKLHEIFKVSEFPYVFDDSACLYGEGYGAKIQKGGGNYIPNGVDFVLFDVKCGDWWLKRDDVIDIAKRLGVGVVPIHAIGSLNDMVEIVPEGFESHWGGFQAEGLVARPDIELKDRSGHRIITKLKCKDFK